MVELTFIPKPDGNQEAIKKKTRDQHQTPLRLTIRPDIF